jgi:hypothetical protein
MRIIVKETNLTNLKVGFLFLVTCTGGSLGREGDHSVLIPDINISKVYISRSSHALYFIVILIDDLTILFTCSITLVLYTMK